MEVASHSRTKFRKWTAGEHEGERHRVSPIIGDSPDTSVLRQPFEIGHHLPVGQLGTGLADGCRSRCFRRLMPGPLDRIYPMFIGSDVDSKTHLVALPESIQRIGIPNIEGHGHLWHHTGDLVVADHDRVSVCRKFTDYACRVMGPDRLRRHRRSITSDDD